MKFKAKPIIVTARKYYVDNADEIEKWSGGRVMSIMKGRGLQFEDGHCAEPGCWIVKGIDGNFHMLPGDEFNASYEEVDEVTPTSTLI